MTGTTVAIDLGGTNVRAAIVADDGIILRRAQRPTPATEPTPELLVRLAAEVVGDGGLDRAVVGVPGVVDHDAEALLKAPNLPPRWIPSLTGDWLAERMGVPVSLANDADLAAVGESAFGAGRVHRDVVYVTISTGVGAGIVVDGSLVRGQHSGGEIGHTIIDRLAARAGSPSTVEELGAGPAIARAATKAGLRQRDGEFADLVRSGHPQAVTIWNNAIEAVGIGVVNMAWLLAPQIVVVGGGVGLNHDLIEPIFSRLLVEHGPALDQPIEIAPAALGDDAGLAGAAAWFEAVGRPVSPAVPTLEVQ
ncbi:MAG: ROK family protein [Actinomycetia bacterium]|nr:ROK family protein [Actinomycetes bacterium]MCP4227243.1 ROK family protein [Actinomycetes bacterium]